MLGHFKNVVDNQVVISESGLLLTLSLGFPWLHSLSFLAKIAGFLLLSSFQTRASTGGCFIWFWCLYSLSSHQERVVLEKEPSSQHKSENKDKYSGNILEAFLYTAFVVSSLQLKTGTLVWHLLQAMTLKMILPQAGERKTGSSTPVLTAAFEK